MTVRGESEVSTSLMYLLLSLAFSLSLSVLINKHNAVLRRGICASFVMPLASGATNLISRLANH